MQHKVHRVNRLADVLVAIKRAEPSTPRLPTLSRLPKLSRLPAPAVARKQPKGRGRPRSD